MYPRIPATTQDRTRRIAALAIAVALHVALVYALLHGLARTRAELEAPPVKTEIIVERAPLQAQTPAPLPPVKLAAPPPPTLALPQVEVEPPRERARVPAAPPAPAPIPPPVPAEPAPAPAPAAAAAPAPAPPARTAPVVLASSCAKPEYPRAARRANETGTVLLSLLVGVDGKVADSKVERSSGSRRLDEAARAALALCRFKPATANGTPVPAWSSIAYEWRLE